jgi:hypothetical protein
MQRHVTSGWLAQLGEHQPYKLGVTGSNPVPPTIYLAPWKRDAVTDVYADR